MEDVERKVLLDIIAKQNETIKVLAEKEDAMTSLSRILGPLIPKLFPFVPAPGSAVPTQQPPFGSSCFPTKEDLFKHDTANPNQSTATTVADEINRIREQKEKEKKD